MFIEFPSNFNSIQNKKIQLNQVPIFQRKEGTITIKCNDEDGNVIKASCPKFTYTLNTCSKWSSDSKFWSNGTIGMAIAKPISSFRISVEPLMEEQLKNGPISLAFSRFFCFFLLLFLITSSSIFYLSISMYCLSSRNLICNLTILESLWLLQLLLLS